MTKPTKSLVRPAKTHINLGICPVWSGSSLSAWRKFGSLATHWAQTEDSDQTRIPRKLFEYEAARASVQTRQMLVQWNKRVIVILTLYIIPWKLLSKAPEKSRSSRFECTVHIIWRHFIFCSLWRHSAKNVMTLALTKIKTKCGILPNCLEDF